MTFVDGFYSFTIDLVYTERDVYETFRVKAAKHPEESFEHLVARMLAYSHCYREGQAFSRGLFDISEPTIVKKDVIDQLELWAQVGDLDQKKLKKALRDRSNDMTEFLVYFFDPAQIESFCHSLRGSKSNWVEHVRFFELDYGFLERIAFQIKSKQSWRVMIVDDAMYVHIDPYDFETSLVELDIWQRFQESIDNA